MATGAEGLTRGARAPRYATGAVLLHWLTAAAFAMQIGLGFRMGLPRGPQTFAVFQLHKSIGITILLLTIARIAWRLLNPPPPFAATLHPWERRLAHIVHVAFYVLLLALPLSGWLMVSSSRVAVPTFLYGTVPWPHVPGVSALAPAARERLNGAASATHLAAVWIALAAIALHVAGAVKHQLLDRDDELARMAPLPRRALGAAAVGIVLAFLGLALLGRRVPLAPIALAPTIPASAPVPAPPAPGPAPVAPSPATPAPPPAASPVVAAEPAPAAVSPDWTVRMAASSIRFHTAWSQGPVDGGFGKWRATIRFDPATLATAAATITIDMASASATDSEQQSALPETDWFAVATHPTATWRATRFRHLGGDRYRADGTLTLRGVSRPLPVAFTLTVAGDVATMAGTASIDRTAFGVGQGEWASTADLPAAVAVQIAIKADRANTKP